MDFELFHTSKGREGREARKCKWRHSVDGGHGKGERWGGWGGRKVGIFLKARQRDQEEKETSSVCPCVFVCARLRTRALRLMVGGLYPTTDPS